MLNNFKEVDEIRYQMEKGNDVFVKVLHGTKRNSVARVISIQRVNFNRHLYRLAIEGQRHFQMVGSNIELTSETETFLAEKMDEKTPSYVDMLNNDIDIGNIMIFWKDNTINFGRVEKMHLKGIDVTHVYPTVNTTSTIKITTKTVKVTDEIDGDLLKLVLSK